MADIIQWNIRSLKVESKSFFKIKKCTEKLEDLAKTNILSIQETHLLSDDEIPKRLKNFDHLYHIKASHATPTDKGAGIILFINKTEEVLNSDEISPGRLIYIKIKNKITDDIRNIFSFYAKSRASKTEIKKIISAIQQK